MRSILSETWTTVSSVEGPMRAEGRMSRPSLGAGGSAGSAGGGLEGILLEACVLQGIEAQVDLLDGLESEVGEESRDDQRGQDGDTGEGERSPDPGCEDVAQEGGTDADPYGEKRHFMARGDLPFQRQDDVEVARRPEDGPHSGDDAGVLEHGIVFPLRQGDVVLGGIGAQQRLAVAVGDGDIEDGRGVAIDRAEQPVQALIMLQDLGNGRAHSRWVIGVNRAAAHAVGDGKLGAVEDLPGHHIVGGIGLADALGEELLQEEPGQNRHHQKDKSGDGEH